MSLFTPVPTTSAIQVSHDRVKSDPSSPYRTSLSVDDICSLLSLCLEATYLALQRQGVSADPWHSDGVTCISTVGKRGHGGRQAGSTIHLPYPPPQKFWRRYANNTCAARPLDLVYSFRSHLNSINPSIQFTMEKESDRQLHFLDIPESR